MKKRNGKQLVCDVCGKAGARRLHVTRTYGKGKNLLIIENVPVGDCPHCGESYLTAQTMHELERLKRQRRALAVARPVEPRLGVGAENSVAAPGRPKPILPRLRIGVDQEPIEVTGT